MNAPAIAPDPEKPRRSVMRAVRKVLKWALYLLLGLFAVILFVGIVGAWPIEIVWFLAFGWIQFLAKNVATMALNLALIAEGVVCAVALAIGTHYFCRWLYRECGSSTGRAWRWQWTASGLALVLLLFVAGIGTIGVTHQAAWLFNSGDPLLVSSWSARSRVSEALLVASGVRSNVRDYYDSNGRLPQSNEEAGYSRDMAPESKLVSAIEIREKGVVAVTLHKDRDWPDGGEITLTPTEDAVAKRLTWKCRSTLAPKLLPRDCRE